MRRTSLTPFFQSNLSPFHWLREMDREFDDLFGAVRNMKQLPNTPLMGQFQESDEAYLVTFDMPGVKMENIDIQADDGHVTVSAERKSEFDNGQTVRKYSQTFSLPENVDAEQIQARYEAGVLHLGLPKVKRPAKEVKKIEVKSDSKPQNWLKFLGFGQTEEKEKSAEKHN